MVCLLFFLGMFFLLSVCLNCLYEFFSFVSYQFVTKTVETLEFYLLMLLLILSHRPRPTLLSTAQTHKREFTV